MQSQEVSIKPTINIVLKPDTETLDEVVVIAYGTAKKESLTGSISVVDNKKRSHLNLLRKYKMGDFCIFVLPQTISYKSPICTKYSAKIQ